MPNVENKFKIIWTPEELQEMFLKEPEEKFEERMRNRISSEKEIETYLIERRVERKRMFKRMRQWAKVEKYLFLIRHFFILMRMHVNNWYIKTCIGPNAKLETHFYTLSDLGYLLWFYLFSEKTEHIELPEIDLKSFYEQKEKY